MNEVIRTRIKLGLIFVVSNLLLFYKSALYFNLIFLISVIILISWQKKIAFYLTWLKPLLGAAIFVFLIQIFAKDGYILAAVSVFRILSLSSLIFLLVYTTRLSLIAQSLNFLPTTISYILSLSLGMIPQLSSEMKKIMIAQQARGHKMDWNIFKSYRPILMPLFTKSFIRAEQISISMQTRGFKLAEEKITS